MNCNLNEVLEGIGDDAGFRAYVRSWLESNFLEVCAEAGGRWAVDGFEGRLAWENRLCRAGWTGLAWPRRYGGLDLSLNRQVLFHEETARLRTPKGVNLVGHGILGPTLLLHGSEEQRQRFLPPLCRNEEIWCQGYSEPDAGSDLAALRTSAIRDGEVYRVNGRKIWTSLAHKSDWCFLLVRTDPHAPKHRGITFLLVDMTTRGISARPIRQMNGDSEFNEVTFDDVAVPASQRVGAENAGWEVAMAAANFERATYFLPRIARMRHDLADLIEVADFQNSGTIEECDLQRRVVDCFARCRSLEIQGRQMLESVASTRHPGPAGSIIKLLWSESRQKLLELAMDILGPGARQLGGARPTSRDWASEYLWTRAETILAGTSEIQRNIIAKCMLELPRETV